MAKTTKGRKSAKVARKAVKAKAKVRAPKPSRAKRTSAKAAPRAPKSAKRPNGDARPSSKPGKAKKAAKPARGGARPKARRGERAPSSRKSGNVPNAVSTIARPTDPVIRDDGRGGAPLKRKLGLRGAAPWAARHAAKHAAEARARAAEPAPPGSARATIRVPAEAEQIKAKITELFNQTQKIKTLRKRLDKGFFEIGEILSDIQQHDLHTAKGYGSFEAFLEREIDLGKQTALKLIKVAHTFQRDAALDYGMDRVLQGLATLDGEFVAKAAPSAPGSVTALPLKPPVRILG